MLPFGNKTKILATLGPSVGDKATLAELVAAGANVFRLNFSHGSHEDHLQRLGWIRELEAEIERPLGVLLDLQGPKLRVGAFAGGGVELAEGQDFRLDLDAAAGDQRRVGLPHREIIEAAVPGMQMLLDDGLIRLEVVAAGDDFIDTLVVVGGALSDRKGVNVPDAMLDLSPLTAKDRDDLAFGLQHGVDWVALSFVQRPDDIEQARALVGDKAMIMAKIEKPSAVAMAEDIVAAADGVMVARGDLGVELPVEQLPVIQKRLVSLCRAAGKPVVVATQMLESMRNAPTPTRAEATDVANAVYDGTDAVMLSAETASGKYPVQTVATMGRIIAQVEADVRYRAQLDADRPVSRQTFADAISVALRRIAAILPVKLIVNYTQSGASSLRMARERPQAPVLSLTPSENAARRLTLSWGAIPVYEEGVVAGDGLEIHAINAARARGLVSTGDTLVITAGSHVYPSGWTNMLRLELVD
jgi:pyruvate kinase